MAILFILFFGILLSKNTFFEILLSFSTHLKKIFYCFFYATPFKTGAILSFYNNF
jgi:hypothetical protein